MPHHEADHEYEMNRPKRVCVSLKTEGKMSGILVNSVRMLFGEWVIFRTSL